VLDRNSATTGHKQKVIYGLSKNSNCDIRLLECTQNFYKTASIITEKN